MTIVLALSTCPDEATAKQLAATLVQERLATCVNRVPGVTSTYFWDGRLQDDAEILLIIKTSQARVKALTERMKTLHPYDLPELVVVPISGGNEAYLQWVREGVEEEQRSE